MDITTGNTTGRDALRTFLRAGTAITDAELLSCWDAAVDATSRWIRPGYTTDAPEGVQQFVLAVAAAIWRTRDSGGDTTVLPDGSITTGPSLQTTILKARHIAGPYVVTPRVIA